jgi:transposase
MLLADQWQTGFVEFSGNAGLLGQTPGRTGRDVIRWLSRKPERWRKGIQPVAIDMSSTYRNGIHTAQPYARVCLVPFDVVQARSMQVGLGRSPARLHAAKPPMPGRDAADPPCTGS